LLQHVRRAQLGVMASGVVNVGESVPNARLEDRNRLRETLAVELHELIGQSSRRLLAADLEDGLEVLGYLAHLEMHHADVCLQRRSRKVIEAVIEKMSDPDFWLLASRIAATVGLLGIIVAALSLYGSWKANKANAKAERARFWLDLRAMFASHDEVHKKLRRHGEWRQEGKEEPVRGAEGDAKLIAYMGLFEHCEYMLEDGLLDEKTFNKIYAYRLDLLLENKRVRQKLAEYDFQAPERPFKQRRSWSRDEEGGWDAFQRLLIRFNKLQMLEVPLGPPPPLTPEQRRQRVTNFANNLKDSRLR
jgi:hypothetical protein